MGLLLGYKKLRRTHDHINPLPRLVHRPRRMGRRIRARRRLPPSSLAVRPSWRRPSRPRAIRGPERRRHCTGARAQSLSELRLSRASRGEVAGGVADGGSAHGRGVRTDDRGPSRPL